MDAGIWVLPMTGKRTLVKSYGTNWDAVEILREICKEGDIYIYNSSTPAGFQKARFARTEWYAPVHVNGNIEVIHVTACIGEK